MQLGKAFAALVGFATVLFFLIDFSPPQPKTKAYYAAMKANLRNLVTAQEAHFANGARYAAQLDSARYVTDDARISVILTRHSDSAWTATATHTETTGVCRIGISVDNAPIGDIPGDGEPVCDPAQPGPRWRFRWAY